MTNIIISLGKCIKLHFWINIDRFSCFVNDFNLNQCVVEYKQVYFVQNWINYVYKLSIQGV